MKTKPTILIDKPFPPSHQAYLEEHCTVLPPYTLDPKPTQDDLNKADALLWYGHEPIDSDLLSKCPNAMVVSNFGAGYEHIDTSACIALDVPVGHTPDCLSECVADYAFAMLLASARDVVEGVKRCEDPGFRGFNPNDLGKQVYGANVGIVGMGGIGGAVAKRAGHGFGMNVFYHNRRRRSEEEERTCGNATYCADLLDMLEKSDYVVLTLPVTPSTVNLMSTEQFKRMRNDAILVNVGRGKLVDTEALVEALLNNEIGRCVLDVTEPEPLPRDHILVRPQNTPLEGRVIITPHAGSATSETRMEMLKMSLDNLFAALGENKGNKVRLPWLVRECREWWAQKGEGLPVGATAYSQRKPNP